MNVCLDASADLRGGALVFPASDAVVRHEPGVAVLHRGSTVHLATRLQAGTRTNLVLWCRSTRERRATGCPLCGERGRNLRF